MRRLKKKSLRIGRGLAVCLAAVLAVGMCMGSVSARAEEGGRELTVLHYYSFNEGDGSDYYQDGINGELVGGAEFAEGKYGQALKLDGTGYVKFPTDVIPAAGSFTISLWAYMQSADNQNSRLISTGVWGGNTPGIELGLHTNVTDDGSWADATYGIGKADGDSYFGFSGAVPYDAVHEAWMHLAYVYNAQENQIRVYMNGEEKGMFDCAGYQPVSKMQEFALGGHLDGGGVGEAFTGLVDDMVVFGQALTPEEVDRIGKGELQEQTVLPDKSEAPWAGGNEPPESGEETPEQDDEPSGAGADQASGLGLLHYYSFDGKNADDYFRNGIDGETAGSVAYAEGKYGQALKLDGKSYVKFPIDILPAPKSFTISMWVFNQTEDNALARLLSTGVIGPDTPGVTLGVHTNVTAAGNWADITFGAGRKEGEGNFHFSYAVPYETLHESWCHVVLVCDAENKLMIVYANGEEKDRLDYTDCQIVSDMTSCALGGHLREDGLEEAFTGLIDDLAIFDKPLTESEVVSLGSGKFMNTVTFETNGGNAVEPAAVFLGEKLEEPTCERTSSGGEEWQLAGWSANPDFYEPYNFDKPVRQDMTLYAMWRQGDQVTVSFEGYEELAQTFGAGGRAQEPETPSRKGFRLSGWYLDENTTVKYDFNETVHVDTKLYPKWTEAETSDSAASVWILAAAVVVLAALALAGVWMFRRKRSGKDGNKK